MRSIGQRPEAARYGSALMPPLSGAGSACNGPVFASRKAADPSKDERTARRTVEMRCRGVLAPRRSPGPACHARRVLPRARELS